MQVTKLSEHLGAEVTGIDLRQPLDAATRRLLNQAVVEHIALVIRDQELTPNQFLTATQLFGEAMDQNYAEHGVPGVPFVNYVSNQFTDKAGNPLKSAAKWHTDSTNFECPPKYTALYALELPDSGGGTAFCNMRAGYAALPEEIRRHIDGFKTVNVRLGSAVKEKYNALAIEAQKAGNVVPVVHPLVRTNPENGQKSIYFNPNKTENIVGMSPEESQELLDDLLQRAMKPEYLYTHQWRKGDLLIWDNRAAMHKANYDYDMNQHRLLYRVCIKGERPV